MAEIRGRTVNGGEVEFYDAATGTVIFDLNAQGAASANLTDNTTGTADDTVVDVGGAFDQATLNNNFADVVAKINNIQTVLRSYGMIP